MLVVYSGPFPEVVVDEYDQGTVITNGEPVDIPDDLAARLIEQSTWSKATPPAPVAPTAPDDTTKESN